MRFFCCTYQAQFVENIDKTTLSFFSQGTGKFAATFYIVHVEQFCREKSIVVMHVGYCARRTLHISDDDESSWLLWGLRGGRVHSWISHMTLTQAPLARAARSDAHPPLSAHLYFPPNPPTPLASVARLLCPTHLRCINVLMRISLS